MTVRPVLAELLEARERVIASHPDPRMRRAALRGLELALAALGDVDRLSDQRTAGRAAQRLEEAWRRTHGRDGKRGADTLAQTSVAAAVRYVATAIAPAASLEEAVEELVRYVGEEVDPELGQRLDRGLARRAVESWALARSSGRWSARYEPLANLLTAAGIPTTRGALAKLLERATGKPAK